MTNALPEPGYHEQWISLPQLAQTAELARSTNGLPGAVLELGAWEGRSAVAIAEAVYPDVLHVVDHFRGTPEGNTAVIARERDLYAQYRANIREWTKGNVRTHRMDTHTYLAKLLPEQMRFCHLDASHEQAQVAEQIAAIWPRVVPGGVLCGDDYAAYPGVNQAVRELLPEHQANGNFWWAQRELLYTPAYYRAIARESLSSARAVLPLVLDDLKPASLVDIGCGPGAWLLAAQEWGVKRLCGIDQPAVPDAAFLADCPLQVLDLARVRPRTGRRFDLALCLEVAEHLPANAAETFVAYVVSWADRVLWSAAVPGQGGSGHVNEQPPAYWEERFALHGYHADDRYRERLAGLDGAAWWYRNNIRLYVKEGAR